MLEESSLCRGYLSSGIRRIFPLVNFKSLALVAPGEPKLYFNTRFTSGTELIQNAFHHWVSPLDGYTLMLHANGARLWILMKEEGGEIRLLSTNMTSPPKEISFGTPVYLDAAQESTYVSGYMSLPSYVASASEGSWNTLVANFKFLRSDTGEELVPVADGSTSPYAFEINGEDAGELRLVSKDGSSITEDDFEIIFGLPYDSFLEFPKILSRTRTSRGISRDRTQLRWLNLELPDTTEVYTKITSEGRTSSIRRDFKSAYVSQEEYTDPTSGAKGYPPEEKDRTESIHLFGDGRTTGLILGGDGAYGFSVSNAEITFISHRR